MKDNKKRPNTKTEFIVNNKIYGLPIYYKKDFLDILKYKKIKEIFIAEDSGFERAKIYKKIKKTKIKLLSFIHKSVKLMGNNKIGEGAIIFPNNYIGFKTDIGKCSILQAGCSIDHHNLIGNFCDINPKVVTGGFTKISNFCEINISTTIINGINIEDNSRIGAGSLVMNNIKKNQLHYGRPAKYIRKTIK